MRTWTALPLFTLLLACGPGAGEGRVDRGVLPEFEAQRSGRDVVPEGGFDAPVYASEPCPPELSSCEFERYNIDVRVGDRFVLTNFLVDCDGELGTDFFFAYEDDTSWNLDVFNTDAVVTIVEADLDGGNHGDGEYRFDLMRADGEQLDHATIRIDHDDTSDVRPGDDVPPPARPECGPTEVDPPNDGEDDCEVDCV